MKDGMIADPKEIKAFIEAAVAIPQRGARIKDRFPQPTTTLRGPRAKPSGGLWILIALAAVVIMSDKR